MHTRQNILYGTKTTSLYGHSGIHLQKKEMPPVMNRRASDMVYCSFEDVYADIRNHRQHIYVAEQCTFRRPRDPWVACTVPGELNQIRVVAANS